MSALTPQEEYIHEVMECHTRHMKDEIERLSLEIKEIKLSQISPLAEGGLTLIPKGETSEFKPCPFCGNDVIEAVKIKNSVIDTYEVKCCAPSCTANVAGWITKATATTAWNKRVDSDD